MSRTLGSLLKTTVSTAHLRRAVARDADVTPWLFSNQLSTRLPVTPFATSLPNSMPSCRLALLLLLSLPLLVHGTALTYNVAAHEKACFFTWADAPGKKVAFYFAVTSSFPSSSVFSNIVQNATLSTDTSTRYPCFTRFNPVVPLTLTILSPIHVIASLSTANANARAITSSPPTMSASTHSASPMTCPHLQKSLSISKFLSKTKLVP